VCVCVCVCMCVCLIDCDYYNKTIKSSKCHCKLCTTLNAETLAEGQCYFSEYSCVTGIGQQEIYMRAKTVHTITQLTW